MRSLYVLSTRHLKPATISFLAILMQRQILSRKRRKMLVVVVSAMFFSLTALAQAPYQFSFQGVARDAAGHIIKNSEIGYSFTIHRGTDVGTVVFSKEGSTVTDASGIFTLTVGTEAFPIPSNIRWDRRKYYLEVGIDPDGATNGYTFISTGSTQLLSVPQALYAQESGKWIDGNPIVQTDNDNGEPNALPFPTVGNGARLIWHPAKSAFRVGNAENGFWDDAWIGNYSFATGQGTKASSDHTTAIGYQSQATASYSTALGYKTASGGSKSLALGNLASTGGDNAISIGVNTIANGANSLAMGESSSAVQTNSIAIGTGAYANGSSAISLGFHTSSAANYGIALGRYNDNSDVPNGSSTDRLFQIGNGVNSLLRSNAMTILKNGNVGIGDNVTNPGYILDVGGRMRIRHNGNTAGVWLDDADGNAAIFMGSQASDGSGAGFYFPPALYGSGWAFWASAAGSGFFKQRVYAQEFVENSDARLKTDIKTLENSLVQLRLLSGYSYAWKADKDKSRHTGVIAQEVEKYFPELVSTKPDGYKAVRYTGLIPHLIEAIKELDKKTDEITALKEELAQVKELNKKVVDMEARLKALLHSNTSSTYQTSAK